MQHSAINNISDRVHPNRVVCSPSNTNGLQLEFVPGKNGGVTATFSCGKDLEGYQGVVHGGIVSSILDGAMGHCMFSRGQAAVTVEMTTWFRHPIITNQKATVSANITSFSHSLCLLEAEIVQNGKVKATAKAKFFNQRRKFAFNGVSYTLWQMNNRH
jgi:acyl-coenzyme A thioesterase PaaI-like protein